MRLNVRSFGIRTESTFLTSFAEAQCSKLPGLHYIERCMLLTEFTFLTALAKAQYGKLQDFHCKQYMYCKKFSFHQQAVQCKIMQFWQALTHVFSVHSKKCDFHQQAVHVQ